MFRSTWACPTTSYQSTVGCARSRSAARTRCLSSLSRSGEDDCRLSRCALHAFFAWCDLADPLSVLFRTQIAGKVKLFFFEYARNRHKMTTITPSYHAVRCLDCLQTSRSGWLTGRLCPFALRAAGVLLTRRQPLRPPTLPLPFPVPLAVPQDRRAGCQAPKSNHSDAGQGEGKDGLRKDMMHSLTKTGH